MPNVAIKVIYILAAVLPAIILLRYIYKNDKVEKEPVGLLVSLLLMGIPSAIVSIVLESIGESILNKTVSNELTSYTLILAFIVVAMVEEGAKLFFLKIRTWKSPHFNYRFDGVVYSVFVSLGFAIVENIGYVFSNGLYVAFIRALTAVPAHMGFAVFMGLFYARAKFSEKSGNKTDKRSNLFVAYLMPVLLHGFYDACAMIGNVLATLLFILFVAVMYIVVILVIKRESKTDTAV